MTNKYNNFIEIIKNASRKNGGILKKIGVVGKNSEYSLYKIIFNKDSRNKKTVCFVCEIHGDETSSYLSVLSFIKQYKPNNLHSKIIILPVCNPYGFENNEYNNHSNINLNRNFLENKLDKDQNILYSSIKNESINSFISFHEDDVQDGFYIYDYCQIKNNNISKKTIRDYFRIWKNL